MQNITFDELPKAVSLLANEISEIKQILLAVAPQQANPEPEQLLTIQQAGQFLNLSVPTIYGYVQRKKIPVNKRGKRLYFSKQELLQWIKEGRKKTEEELEEEAQQHLSNLKRRS